MWGLHSQLPRTREELVKHISALQKTEAKEIHRDLFGHLYTSLTILDTKSASLLQFDSILIAIYSIYIVNTKNELFGAFLSVGILSVIASTITLLNVVWVHWSTTSDLMDPKEHILLLLTVRNRRTALYRLSWYGAMLAVFLLLFFMLNEVLSKLHIATPFFAPN